MKFVNTENRIPITSWCADIEKGAMEQAVNLANHPVTVKHIALMPDCHQGYGMPIGGVIACNNAVIPNAVGVDIGCGMSAVKTDFIAEELSDVKIKSIIGKIRKAIPVGEGHAHKEEKYWDSFNSYEKEYLFVTGIEHPCWFEKDPWKLTKRNLGTLGGGNHFIELQKGDDRFLWLMLHSGSRNLGHRIASAYHKLAVKLNHKWMTFLPSDDLAFFPADSEQGRYYIRDMNFALKYALENRTRMMAVFKDIVYEELGCDFDTDVNIHHNYAAIENHFGRNLWIHRKGATSAKPGQIGIIPGSMGTPSYIVEGLGNRESFMSCSHGAGRKMSRSAACKNLTEEDCNKAMKGIVFGRWNKIKIRGKKGKSGTMLDLGESPLAYKDIEDVIDSQRDLVKPMVRLIPLGVVKG